MNKILSITLMSALFCVATGLQARRHCRGCRPCCRPCTTKTVNTCSGNSCSRPAAAQAVTKKVYQQSNGCASGLCRR